MKDFPLWVSEDHGVLGCRRVSFNVRYYPDARYEIELAGGPDLTIRADLIRLDLDPTLELDVPSLVDLILGPALLLALALHGTFALHASAVAIGSRAAIFLGDSGAGKSTLAAALDGRAASLNAPSSPSAQAWFRLVDDVLPVTLGADGVPYALPEYPQLKLPPEAQYVAGTGRPERVPIAALYLLEAFTDDAGDGGDPSMPRPSAGAVTCEPITGRDALTTVIAHTIASRLFAPDLAARHFDFCANIAGTVPIKRLRYPRRLDAFDAVAAALAADLGQG